VLVKTEVAEATANDDLIEQHWLQPILPVESAPEFIQVPLSHPLNFTCKIRRLEEKANSPIAEKKAAHRLNIGCGGQDPCEVRFENMDHWG